MPTKEPRLIVIMCFFQFFLFVFKVERLVKKKVQDTVQGKSSPPRFPDTHTHTRFLRPLPSLYVLAHIF